MTVFVLGAGASHHVGYPLASSMGRDLLDWMERSTGSPLEYPKVAGSLEELFGSNDNIEDLLSSIQTLIREYEAGTAAQRGVHAVVAQARFALIQALREWFVELRQEPAVAYQQFALDVVRPGDCIITFNYDVSLERELKRAGKWEIGDGYGFPISNVPSRSSVLELKLHGSANWLALLFGGRRSGAFALGNSGVFGARPVIGSDELAFLGYEDQRDSEFQGESAAQPVLIMPARSKEFFFRTNLGDEWDGFWNALWNQAGCALRRAKKVVMCGYSLLAVDGRACQLLLENTPKTAEMLIVAGNDSNRIGEEYRKRGFQAHVASELLFEHWVASERT